MLPLLDLFVVALGALAGGWVCRRFGVPEVLGYLAAGVALGPAAHPGTAFVDEDTIRAIGGAAVLFRMFTLGLDFDARRLRGQWRPALAAGLLEMSLCTLAGVALAAFMGWSPLEGAVLGAALGTTSTSILSKALADRGMSTREDARAAGAATLTEDLIAMGLIALLTVFSGATGGGEVVARALELVVFASLAFTAGAILVPIALDRLGRSKSDELVTLAVMGGLFGFAALSFGLGAGVAIGAFLAGVAVGAARNAPGVSARVLPLRDLLAAVAYVALGLLLDPLVILRIAPVALVVVLGFVAMKVVAVAVGLRLGGVPAVTAARAGAILGQAGTMGLVFVCAGFLDPAHLKELLAFAFVSWAFTVALTPLRLRFGPGAAERIARALGARDAAPRSTRAPLALDGELRADLGVAILTSGCAIALGALAALASRAGDWTLPLVARPYVITMLGLLAGAAALPFALAASMATRRAARARIHRAALRPRRLTRGSRDDARAWSGAATVAALLVSLAAPVGIAFGFAPEHERIFLAAGLVTGMVALLARPKLVERLMDECERLARARDTRKADVRLHDFRGVSPLGFEVEALLVRDGTAAAWTTLRALRLPERTGARVVAVLRAGSHDAAQLGPDTVLHPGDEAVLGGTPAQLVAARRAMLEASRADAAVDQPPAGDGRVDAKPVEREPRVA